MTGARFCEGRKTLAGVVDLKNVVAGEMISGFVKSMFEASDPESVEELQNTCLGNYTNSYVLMPLFRGGRNTFEALVSKSVKCMAILGPSLWPICYF